mmetsp:Transcript_15485/g.42798  ORF Transcript_15485/g.42798 Transcript_15485/m.42798 type:complete len:139 (-) Transcript_15485:1145-1561(-)
MRSVIFALASLLVIMFSSSMARAFRPVAHTYLVRSPQALVSRTTALTTPRFLSSDTPDTTIVDICKEKIQAALDTQDVKVTGAYDDPNGSHISIEVVSSKFKGKRSVQRQQLVYKAIWEEMQGAVHAVDSMVCKAPDE